MYEWVCEACLRGRRCDVCSNLCQSSERKSRHKQALLMSASFLLQWTLKHVCSKPHVNVMLTEQWYKYYSKGDFFLDFHFASSFSLFATVCRNYSVHLFVSVPTSVCTRASVCQRLILYVCSDRLWWMCSYVGVSRRMLSTKHLHACLWTLDCVNVTMQGEILPYTCQRAFYFHLLLASFRWSAL